MHEPTGKPSVAGGTSTAEKLCFDKNEFMKVRILNIFKTVLQRLWF